MHQEPDGQQQVLARPYAIDPWLTITASWSLHPESRPATPHSPPKASRGVLRTALTSPCGLSRPLSSPQLGGDQRGAAAADGRSQIHAAHFADVTVKSTVASSSMFDISTPLLGIPRTRPATPSWVCYLLPIYISSCILASCHP